MNIIMQISARLNSLKYIKQLVLQHNSFCCFLTTSYKSQAATDEVNSPGTYMSNHDSCLHVSVCRRSEGRYSYKREVDGFVQWEYPAVASTDMDISTTPPPPDAPLVCISL